MIKGRLTREGGKTVLLLGLSRENCTRLLNDQPIHITDLPSMGLPDMEVIIIADENEAALARTLGRMPLQPEVPGQTFWLPEI